MGFQFMLILGLLGMYFDAAVVFVMKSSLFFRLAVAILCIVFSKNVAWVSTADTYLLILGLLVAISDDSEPSWLEP